VAFQRRRSDFGASGGEELPRQNCNPDAGDSSSCQTRLYSGGGASPGQHRNSGRNRGLHDDETDEIGRKRRRLGAKDRFAERVAVGETRHDKDQASEHRRHRLLLRHEEEPAHGDRQAQL